jgi:hypothetical protein
LTRNLTVNDDDEDKEEDELVDSGEELEQSEAADVCIHRLCNKDMKFLVAAIFDLSMGLTEKKRRDSLSSAHV